METTNNFGLTQSQVGMRAGIRVGLGPVLTPFSCFESAQLLVLLVDWKAHVGYSVCLLELTGMRVTREVMADLCRAWTVVFGAAFSLVVRTWLHVTIPDGFAPDSPRTGKLPARSTDPAVVWELNISTWVFSCHFALFLPLIKWGQAQWLTPVTSTIWEAERGRSLELRDWPGEYGKTLVSTRNTKLAGHGGVLL